MSDGDSTGHSVVLEAKSASNLNTRTLYLVGGYSAQGSYLDDIWTWRLDIDGDFWRRDFTPQAMQCLQCPI